MSLCHLFKMRTFNHESYPVKVIFGNNTLIKIVDEVKRLKSSHVLLLSTPFQEDLAQRVSQLLKESESPVKITLYSKAVMHTPIEVTQDAMKNMDDVDCIIAVGGGSTTGLSKAITLQKAGGMHQIIVPTTYAGSEATPVVGQTQDQKKTTTRDMKILPGTIIYDVSLTLTLPPLMTCTSGLNAIAHSVEAL
ncbi:hypothetical protein L7F22_042201 [Adiantum nelumboides]|nr:hypothetical protein [Adiantum nelumboides]